VDSSVLVKRYVVEPGSAWFQTLCDPALGHVFAVVHIGLVEIAAALGIKHRQGVLPTIIRDGLLRDLHHDAQNQYWLVDVDEPLIAEAITLTRRQKLRGYDAVHLAGALFLEEILLDRGLPAPVLLSAYQELLVAAQAEGLPTDNPNLYS
jgi:hypothetical protein